jgi:hypothetical protein
MAELSQALMPWVNNTYVFAKVTYLPVWDVLLFFGFMASALVNVCVKRGVKWASC